MPEEKKPTYRGFTEAQARAHKKYIAQFVEVKIRVEPERREEIKAAAAAAGESVNSYINGAIEQRMEREGGAGAASGRAGTRKKRSKGGG